MRLHIAIPDEKSSVFLNEVILPKVRVSKIELKLTALMVKLLTKEELKTVIKMLSDPVVAEASRKFTEVQPMVGKLIKQDVMIEFSSVSKNERPKALHEAPEVSGVEKEMLCK